MTMSPITIQERIPLPPGLPARPAVASGLTPADIVRVLRQRLFMILTIWVLATGATVAGTWWCDKYYSTYQAKAYVRVDSPYPRTPLRLDEQGVASELMNRYVADQAMLMKEDQVLRNTVMNSDVTSTDWYAAQPRELLVEHLKDDLSVSPTVGTSYITISFTARSPEDATRIVNTLVRFYRERAEEISGQKYTKELGDYRDQEQSLKKRIESLTADKAKFMTEQFSTPGIMDNINVVGETLRAIAGNVVQLEAEKLQYKALYDNLSGTGSDQIVVSPEMAQMIQQDPRVSSLQQNKAFLEQQMAISLRQYGPKHRSVENLQGQIDVVSQELEKTIAQKEKEARDYQVNSSYTRYLNALQAQDQMTERKMEEEAKQRDLDQAKARFQDMELELLRLTEERNQLLQFGNQLQLMTKGQDMLRITTFPATKPQTKNFPQWTLMVPGGSILGLVFAMGLAMLLELMDTSMRTPRDVIRHAHVPVLGTVPDLDDEEIPIDTIELASHSAPRSMTAESFRNIRTNLLLSSPAERQRTVLVTSAKPEEGKSTIACNLAISIGQSGRRVLLIDANFHRPMLHQIFNRPQRDGLSNALIGQAKLQDLVQRTDLPNLDIITSGPIPPNPTELLSGHYFRELIAQATDTYDQIIFDGPPVLLLSDSLVLAGSLDGVIIVCRAKATSRGAVQRAREQVERVNGRIFGAILNAARVRRGGYFREQIRTYYDYQPEEVLAAQNAKSLPKNKTDEPEAT